MNGIIIFVNPVNPVLKNIEVSVLNGFPPDRE